MRLHYLSLLAGLIAVPAALFAQLPAKANPALVTEVATEQGPQSGKMVAAQLDSAKWNLPLVPVTGEEQRFFRTFRFGSVGWTARTEYAGEGGVIIGFEFNVGKVDKSASINSIRPIYLINNQKVPGGMVGSTKGSIQRCIAKEGYAVSSVVFAEMAVLAGTKVTFARLMPNGTLSEKDTYEGPAIGEGGGTVVDAGGLPFCGFYTSPGEDLAHLSGFGFLVSQKLVREKMPELTPTHRGESPAVARRQPAPAAPVPQPAAPVREVVTEASPDVNRQINTVLQTSNDRLVLVTGANGKGSGFVCKLDGKPFVLTNQHVVAGNPNAEFSGLARGRLNVGDARAAMGHDLLALALPDDAPAFELPGDFAKEVSLGDPIIVLGDADGAGVVRPSLGRLVGIGPNLVEISAQILPGNSGSPIIHLKTGKVIGIASYITAKEFDTGQGRVAAQIRRFGFRIDSAKKWQPVDWGVYQAEATAMAASSAYTEALFKIFQTITNGTFKKTAFLDPRLAQAMQAIPNNLFKTPTPLERANITTNFMRGLRAGIKFHSDDMRRRLRYDYFQRDSADEEKMREAIVGEIDKLKERLPLNPERPERLPIRR